MAFDFFLIPPRRPIWVSPNKKCRKEASSLANKENIDEEGFFTGMIRYFKTKFGIHDQQVFAVGTSGGGHMCYKLAMTLPDTDPEDEKIIEKYMFKEKGKPEVVLLKVLGGLHDYPGDIDVHVEAWQFFKRQLQKD